MSAPNSSQMQFFNSLASSPHKAAFSGTFARFPYFNFSSKVNLPSAKSYSFRRLPRTFFWLILSRPASLVGCSCRSRSEPLSETSLSSLAASPSISVSDSYDSWRNLSCYPSDETTTMSLTLGISASTLLSTDFRSTSTHLFSLSCFFNFSWTVFSEVKSLSLFPEKCSFMKSTSLATSIFLSSAIQIRYQLDTSEYPKKMLSRSRCLNFPLLSCLFKEKTLHPNVLRCKLSGEILS